MDSTWCLSPHIALWNQSLASCLYHMPIFKRGWEKQGFHFYLREVVLIMSFKPGISHCLQTTLYNDHESLTLVEYLLHTSHSSNHFTDIHNTMR